MKKNIAIVITRLDLGGAQKIALYLADKLNKKKFNVHFITGENGYLDYEAKKIKGIKLVFLKSLKHPISIINDIIALFKLKKYFIQNKIDIVHTHSSKAGIIGRFAAKMAGVKLIIHTIHGFPFHKYQNPINFFVYLILERIAAKCSHKLVAVGEDVVKHGLENKVGRKEQYLIIRAGIDINLFKNAKVNRKQYLSKYGLDTKFFTVGMIGNLKKQKNPFEFIKIAMEVLKREKNIQFVFAGDGYLKSRIEKFLKKNKLNENIKFIGWIKDAEKFLKAIDVFILTSLWEGLPCTLVQALFSGKPCIATNINGNKEIMNKVNPDFLYEPGNYNDAAEKIILLKEKRKIKFNFPLKILKEFDLKFMLREYEKLYYM